MSFGNGENGRFFLEIHLHGVGITRCKGIALDFLEQIGRCALDGIQLVSFDAQLRQGLEQCFGIGMGRLPEDFSDGSAFDDLTGVHDADPVGHVGHNTQVVGDVNHRHFQFLLQLTDELEDLRLHGHVQCGSGLVTDQNLGTAGNGGGNDHALTHTAGKLVGILFIAVFGVGNAHTLEDFDGLLLGLLMLSAEMPSDDLSDLLTDGAHRVQRGHGILEDHSDLLAADAEPLFLGGILGQIFAPVQNLSAGDRTVFVQHTDKGFGKHAFAAAGFAHDSKGFAFIKIQRCAADGGQGAAA